MTEKKSSKYYPPRINPDKDCKWQMGTGHQRAYLNNAKIMEVFNEAIKLTEESAEAQAAKKDSARMQYLKKECPECGAQKLFPDSQGMREDGNYSEWIRCGNCGDAFSYKEIGVKEDIKPIKQNPVKRRVVRQLFHGKIFTDTRQDIIAELKWWIEQLELGADEGGTNDCKTQGTWSIADGV